MKIDAISGPSDDEFNNRMSLETLLKVLTQYLMIVLYSRGVHGLDFGFFESRLLLLRTGS